MQFLPRIPRLPFVRALVPRASAPILPIVARLRTTSPLTNVPRLRFFQYSPSRLTSANPSGPNSPTDLRPPENATLSQRLRHLIRTYGWYALGVYFILMVLDFGVAFVSIQLLGAEQVSRFAASVKEFVVGLIRSRPPDPGHEEMDDPTGGAESFYAVLVLAYTIHKTLFLPIRVGLTAALTPRLVSGLAKRGWIGTQGAKRAAQEMRDRLKRGRD